MLAAFTAYAATEINGIYYNLDSSTLTAEVSRIPRDYSGEITIPSTVSYENCSFDVTSIRHHAASGCSNLTSVIIGNNVKIIDYAAFRNCSGITTVIIGNNVTDLGEEAFQSCSSLISINIPNSVTSIGDWAFKDCSVLSSVSIGNNVTNIGNYAFDGCYGLTSIDIPNSVATIGNCAFHSCLKLTSIVIPNSVTSIGYGTFRDCSSLTSVTIGDGVTSIGSETFRDCSSLTSIDIPDGVTSIGDRAFYECTGLASVSIGKNVTSIGNYAFSGCYGLTSINIPNNVTSIGNCAFQSCLKLTSITIPNSVTTIEERVFESCSGLTSIDIPNSVTNIGNYTFSGCSGLTSITIPNSVTCIGEGAFRSCYRLTTIKVDPNNSIYDSRDNCDAIIETATNTLIVGCQNTIILNSVTTIGSYAFFGCSGLTSIVIPSSVTTIGRSAFQNCILLDDVTIGYNVSRIGDYAFWYCRMTSVTVENPIPLAVTSTTFFNPANATLYVPLGSKSAYQEADYWKEFKEIKEYGTLRGDVNGDGTVTITDVSLMVAYILGQQSDDFIAANADVNGDGSITVTDVMETVRIILEGNNNNTPAYLTCPDDNHPHMIDLGLPSGTLWACCNVGANKPDDYGGYYAWGETEEKDVYSWNTYIHRNNNDRTCYDLGSDIAGTQYDVAHVRWGGSWVMPSHEQQMELLNNCTLTWTTVNDIYGCIITGKNGGSIFLPEAGYAAGYLGNDGYICYGCSGNYWSSTQYPSVSFQAYSLYFSLNFDSSQGDELEFFSSYDDRNLGLSVRPVSVESTFRPLAVSMSNVEINVGDTQTVEITSGNGSYIVNSSDTNVATASLSGTTITITGVAPGSAVVTVTDTATGNSQDVSVTVIKKQAYLSCPDDNHPHMIDLGLPSGTKWACCNVGADKPEANGGYYAWGETKEKNSYDWNTYTYCNGSINTCHNLGDDIAGTQYDVANVKWGADWVMPSYTQFEELLDNCFGKRVIINGVDGYQFTSQNGGAIFLPAAGCRWDKDLYDDSDGYYWTSSQHPTESSSAYYLVFGLDSSNMDYSHCRCDGRNVRPVFLGSTSQSFVLSVNNVEISECETAVVEITSGNGSYTVVSSNIYVATASLSGTTITITGVACGTAVVTVTDTATGNSQDVKVTVSLQAYLTCPDGHHPHLIDLGLESGTLWACCNVGANKPDDYGDYYAWGETEVKDYYDWNNYQYYQNDRYVYIGYENKGTQYDVAHVKWGGYWVIPPLILIEEMMENCTSEWTTKNGVTGLTFTGPSGGSIFLPAAGYRWGYELKNASDCGYYWASSQYRYGSADHAYDMLISQFPEFNENYRYCGHTVRPVWEP